MSAADRRSGDGSQNVAIRGDASRRRHARAIPRLAPWQERLAKETMSARLASDIAMTEVARACRLSLCHFTRAFGNTVGVAPYRWFLAARIERAKDLLTGSRLPLAEIALECGFVDQSHFTNTFVRRVGTTPRRWRVAAEMEKR